MKINPTYQLTHEEIQLALIDYINMRMNSEYNHTTIDSVVISSDPNNGCFYKAYVQFKEEVV